MSCVGCRRCCRSDDRRAGPSLFRGRGADHQPLPTGRKSCRPNHLNQDWACAGRGHRLEDLSAGLAEFVGLHLDRLPGVGGESCRRPAGDFIADMPTCQRLARGPPRDGRRKDVARAGRADRRWRCRPLGIDPMDDRSLLPGDPVAQFRRDRRDVAVSLVWRADADPGLPMGNRQVAESRAGHPVRDDQVAREGFADGVERSNLLSAGRADPKEAAGSSTDCRDLSDAAGRERPVDPPAWNQNPSYAVHAGDRHDIRSNRRDHDAGAQEQPRIDGRTRSRRDRRCLDGSCGSGSNNWWTNGWRRSRR